MTVMPFLARAAATMAAMAVAALAGIAGARAEDIVRYRGTIETADRDAMVMKTRAGQTVVLGIPDRPRIFAATRGKLSDVKPESYVGATTIARPDGTQAALQVTVFASSLRGIGRGRGPSNLRNGATATNGAVAGLGGTTGRSITLRFEGGETTVVAAADVPVDLVDPGDRSLLVSGAPVVALTRASRGRREAAILVVGRNGTVPAM